ncbi:MAG: YdcF family protein [Rikenellaceae bacterium]|jgi:uncharacterized SAM-binding protein YcdF (DUF218 family)|nr:YdcF family protein [Rikenellaceae bacterium]
MSRIFRIKGFLANAAVVLGLLCVLTATVLSVAYGFTIGNAMAYTAGAALIALGWGYGRMPRWARRTVNVAATAGVALFVTVLTIIIIGGSRDTLTYTEDYVLVLGCGVRGETVLPTLAARLDRCIEYAARNPQAPIVVSGGQGSREKLTEAEAMYRYLVARGVEPSRIIREPEARNTKENFEYSKTLMDSIQASLCCAAGGQRRYTVACITSDYHVYRSGLVARRAGVDAGFAASGVKWYLRPSGWAREVLSVLKYWIFK